MQTFQCSYCYASILTVNIKEQMQYDQKIYFKFVHSLHFLPPAILHISCRLLHLIAAYCSSDSTVLLIVVGHCVWCLSVVCPYSSSYTRLIRMVGCEPCLPPFVEEMVQSSTFLCLRRSNQCSCVLMYMSLSSIGEKEKGLFYCQPLYNFIRINLFVRFLS